MNGNAALWFVDRHVSEVRGTKTAFKEVGGKGRTLLYKELSEQDAFQNLVQLVLSNDIIQEKS